MGNTSEKNLTTHRWFIKKINTDQTISLIPLSLNAMFQIQTSLFKSPNCNEVTLNSKDIIYLNDKEILINETQEKEEILYDEIENSQYPIFRNERFTTNRNDFFTLKAYDYKYLNDFSLFYYSCLFNEVTLDLKDPLIIQFCNHATLLRNDTIHFLKNNFVTHLINNRRLKKDVFTFEKLIKVIKEDIMTNFKIFNYNQIYVNSITKENYLQIIPKMLSEEGDLFNILRNPESSVTICMLFLFVLFIMDNISNDEEIPSIYCSIDKENIDTDNLFIIGNLITNKGFLSFTKTKDNFVQKNIIEIEVDNPNYKFNYASSHLYDISHKSLFKNENEVIIQPNSIFEVKSMDINEDDNTVIIRLKMKTNFFSDFIPCGLGDTIKHNLGICDNTGDNLLTSHPNLPIGNICSITFNSFSHIRSNSLFIGGMKNLFSLDLSNSGINDNDLIYLTPYIINLTFLKYLNLSQNSLSSSSISFLTQTFGLLKQLEYLNLNQNELGDDGIIELSKELDKLSNLQNLNLVYNKIKYYGLNALGKKLSQLKKLKVLNLSGNFVYNEEMDALITSLNSLNSLNNLNLANNQIMSDGLVLLSSKLIKLPHLQHLNISENCVKAKGFVALAENLKACPNLLSLIFYGNQIGSSGMKALVENLDSVPLLQVLNIGFNLISDDEMIILANGLYKIPNLQVLNLRENSIGQKGMRAFIYNAICVPNLISLDLGWNQIFFESLAGFPETIRNLNSFMSFNIGNNPIRVACLKTFLHELKGIEPSWTLVKAEFIKKREKYDYEEIMQKYLEKSRCSDAMELKIINWSVEEVKRINSCNNLQKLDLSKQKIGIKGIKELSETFAKFSKLKHLNLRGNELYDEGVAELAKNFDKLKQIEILNLRENKISVDGIKSISENFSLISSSIKTLNLSWNRLEDKGMEILCSVDLSNLECLKLKQNSITVEGLGYLTKLFHKLDKLTYLDLSWNKLGPKGLVLLSEKMSELKMIKALYISQNDFKDEAMEIFSSSMKEKGTFESISLMNNKISDEGGEFLLDYITNSTTIVFFDVSLNNFSENLKLKFRDIMEKKNINLEV